MVEAAGGSGLLVGAPYAGLGLANFGKVPNVVGLHVCGLFLRSISSTQARSCQEVTSALSVREHLHLAQGGE